MYNNPYMNTYNPQQIRERIESQIAQLQQMENNLPQAVQPPAINQTFQLAPNNASGIKYVNNIEEVKKEVVYVDTPFFSNDLSVLWLKSAKGNIKAYELKEIVEKDEKDLLIESLQIQINELRKEIDNAKSINANVNEPVEDEKPSNVSNVKSRKSQPNGNTKANE